MTENAQRNREAEVNLLAAAREAQWSAAAFMGPNTMKLVSPAKVNLLLAIGARREDGYHDADTIMHALALHDTLYLCAEDISADELAKRTAEGASREDVAVGGPADNLVMTIDLADRTGQDLAVPAADNLAFKAADRLSRAVGRDLPEAIQLRIEKHIPAQGGLGGGSSNAAAVLVGLAKAWGLAADDERVADVARSLGADVAFFLHGGCALLGGVGEVLQRRLETSRRSVVLVKPAEGVCTAEAYKRFDAAPRPVPQDVLVCDLAATRADDVVLANNLAPAAEALLPELPSIREWLAEQAGSESVLLSGSGSATFALVDTFAGASRIATAGGRARRASPACAPPSFQGGNHGFSRSPVPRRPFAHRHGGGGGAHLRGGHVPPFSGSRQRGAHQNLHLVQRRRRRLFRPGVGVRLFRRCSGGARPLAQLHDRGSCRPPHHPHRQLALSQAQPQLPQKAPRRHHPPSLAMGEIKNSL